MRRNTTTLVPSLAIALMVVAWGLALPARAQATAESVTLAEEQLAGTILTLVPRMPYQSAVLRVAGPDDYALTKRFNGGAPVTADLLTDAEPDLTGTQQEILDDARPVEPPAVLPDGRYFYELQLISGDDRVATAAGSFYVERGEAVRREAARMRPTELPEETASAAIDTAPSGAVSAASEDPQTLGGDSADDLFVIFDAVGDGFTSLDLRSGAGSPIGDRVRVNNNDTALRLEAGGTTQLTLLPIGSSGFGTVAPQSRLHIHDSPSAILSLSTDGPTRHTIASQESSGALLLGRFGRSSQIRITPDAPTHTLYLGEDGLGIGTSSPAADLDVHSLDGAGNTAVRFTNSDTTWSNAVRSSDGNFVFNRIGSGGAEFTVRPRLDADGATLDVQGSVRGTQFISTSSREVKTAFEDLQPVDVLVKLAALPVSAWRYVWEDASARHVGPVAEDFQRLFGLGDGKTIGTVDADGVLMAAVQGLKRLLDAVRAETAAKDGQISELRAANAELEARLAALEARLSPPSP